MATRSRKFSFDVQDLADEVTKLKNDAEELVKLLKNKNAKVIQPKPNEIPRPRQKAAIILEHLRNAIAELEGACSGPNNPMDIEYEVEPGE